MYSCLGWAADGGFGQSSSPYAGLSNYGQMTVTGGVCVENDDKKVGLWSPGDHKKHLKICENCLYSWQFR